MGQNYLKEKALGHSVPKIRPVGMSKERLRDSGLILNGVYKDNMSKNGGCECLLRIFAHFLFQNNVAFSTGNKTRVICLMSSKPSRQFVFVSFFISALP